MQVESGDLQLPVVLELLKLDQLCDLQQRLGGSTVALIWKQKSGCPLFASKSCWLLDEFPAEKKRQEVSGSNFGKTKPDPLSDQALNSHL